MSQPTDPFVLVRPGPQRFVPRPQAAGCARPCARPPFPLSKAVCISRRAQSDVEARRWSPSRSARRRRAMAPNSLSNASANCCTPSLTSSAVISLQRDAVPLQFGEHRAGAVDVLLDGVGHRPHRDRGTRPWSPAVWCRRCRGRSAPRHTSCPCRLGFLVLVEAQSSRCVLAPAAASFCQRGPENSAL